MKFSKYINEMANIGKLFSGIENYKFHILQLGNRKLSHGPRVKVFTKGKINDSLLISLGKNISILEEPKTWNISNKDMKKILRFIKHNKDNFLSLWFDLEAAPEDFNWIKIS